MFWSNDSIKAADPGLSGGAKVSARSSYSHRKHDENQEAKALGLVCKGT